MSSPVGRAVGGGLSRSASARRLDPRVFDAALSDLREKSRSRLHQRDFDAWLWDVLGERTYAKMSEISHDVLLGEKNMTLVKSSNGSGKTFMAARWVTWWVTVFDPDESLAICTAPTLRQVEMGIFANLKRLYGDQKARAALANEEFRWPGWITEQNEWKYLTPGGNQTLAIAAVPSATDAQTRLVGLRRPGGRNGVFADESGGLSDETWDAINALLTSGGSRFGGIGNPNNRGDGFWKRFTDTRLANEYNLHTISAYDLPTMTGEVVYPGEPERDRALKEFGLTSKRWVAMMERTYLTGGEEYTEEDSGLVRVRMTESAKPESSFKVRVLGEFADETDTAFFPQRVLDRAWDTTIVEDLAAPLFLGCDVARYGNDESVIYTNRGGLVRFLDSWDKADTVDTARRIHEHANRLGAAQVRIDSSGVGASVYDMLSVLPEFADRVYVLIGIDGGVRAPDPSRWAQTRSWNHDMLREAMSAGLIDLDKADERLRNELYALTYRMNQRNALQITPKDDLRKAMGGSPDRLDAVIYATCEVERLLAGAFGDVKRPVDPRDFMDSGQFGLETVGGMPFMY